MKSKIQKWGNSLAIRIPKAFADELRLENNSQVEVIVREDVLEIRPRSDGFKLDDLLNRIRKSNRHGEEDFGDAVGREAW